MSTGQWLVEFHVVIRLAGNPMTSQTMLSFPKKRFGTMETLMMGGN